MRFFTFAFIAACTPFAANAYVGPGAGLGAIAVAMAIVIGLLLLVIGFLWYPLKRLLRRNKTAVDKTAPSQTED